MAAVVPDKHDRMIDYAKTYRATSEFEDVMVTVRQELVLELLTGLRPAQVIEVGCGSDPLLARVTGDPVLSEVVGRWVTIEPSEVFAGAARAACTDPGRHMVIENFVEDAVAETKKFCPEPDLILCCSLLHEVPNAGEVLGGLHRLMSSATVLHVSVPNALSMHRRLARSMGLITDEHELGGRNRMLQQRQVFDAATLEAMLAEAGFVIAATGGLFIKPFNARADGADTLPRQRAAAGVGPARPPAA